MSDSPGAGQLKVQAQSREPSGLSEQALPEQALPEQALPEQALPDQALPDQAAPHASPKPKAGDQRLKLLLLMVLVAIAAFTAWRVYEPSVVKWHLGTLRQDPASQEARNGLRSLGERVYPYLQEELTSEDADSRFVVILALSALEGVEADRLLVLATSDDDGLNAVNAVSALDDRGRAGAALAAMPALLESDTAPMRFAARRLCGRLTGIPWWAFGRDAAEADVQAAPEDS